MEMCLFSLLLLQLVVGAPLTDNEVNNRIVAVSKSRPELLSTAVSSALPSLLRTALTLADPVLLEVALTKSKPELLKVALREATPNNLEVALTFSGHERRGSTSFTRTASVERTQTRPKQSLDQSLGISVDQGADFSMKKDILKAQATTDKFLDILVHLLPTLSDNDTQSEDTEGSGNNLLSIFDESVDSEESGITASPPFNTDLNSELKTKKRASQTLNQPDPASTNILNKGNSALSNNPDKVVPILTNILSQVDNVSPDDPSQVDPLSSIFQKQVDPASINSLSQVDTVSANGLNPVLPPAIHSLDLVATQATAFPGFTPASNQVRSSVLPHEVREIPPMNPFFSPHVFRPFTSLPLASSGQNSFQSFQAPFAQFYFTTG